MSTDPELDRIQAQAAKFSGVKLRREQCAEAAAHCRAKKPQPAQPDSDSMLLLGLMLILASDGADKMLLLMLLYIFQKS